MRVRTAFGIAVVAAVLVAGAGTATADSAITVFPPEAEPGSPIIVQVSCSGGARWVEYTSPAFSTVLRVTLDGADSEERIVLKEGLEPGDYQIRGECGASDSSRVLYSSVTVVGKDGGNDREDAPASSSGLAVPPPTPTPSGAPQTGGGGLHRPADPAVPLAALAVGLLLVSGAGLLSYRCVVRHVD
ncbi:hypothetical protein NI17_001930 [Thermobifida halotolerans]|uniref:Uncharacterized protein n=1 Tax=Thermobifida halotolerans TaxID=483545 RepID=A0AA97LXI2_9ACTN|nr:hypothetical protein [Thermobifida halotolerans]UOE20037.1 hypothetical protein NI17_001930 [Thermobifida halotolerans]